MKARFNTIRPYFRLNITLRSLYCNFKCSIMLCSSIVIKNMNSIVYHLIIERYSMKTLHWYFTWATALDLYNMTGRGEKLQQLHCYHPFSDSLDIYLTKNHYENYSPKMVPIAKIWGSGSWTKLTRLKKCSSDDLVIICLRTKLNFLRICMRSVIIYWPALCAGLLCCNFFGQPGSVSKFPPLLWVKLWVGWVGRGYTEIRRYFPASWINWVTLVTKIKLLYSLRF